MVSSQTTRVQLNAARTISLNSIRVDGIIATNATNGNVEIEFVNASNDAIMSIPVKANDSVVWDIPFMADNGLRCSAGAGNINVSVTVTHSAEGA